MNKMDEDSNSSQSQDGEQEAAHNLTTSAAPVHYQHVPSDGVWVTVGGTTTQIAVCPLLPTEQLQLGEGPPVTQGLHTLTMTNSSPPASSTGGGTTIVQYAQGPDGHFYIPVPGSNGQAYQIATTLAQGVVIGGGESPMSSPAHGAEECSQKRELRLLKNREAARECRRKKKEYVKCLENRVAVLENQNKTLIEELKALKELYCQKDG